MFLFKFETKQLIADLHNELKLGAENSMKFDGIYLHLFDVNTECNFCRNHLAWFKLHLWILFYEIIVLREFFSVKLLRLACGIHNSLFYASSHQYCLMVSVHQMRI